MTTNKGSRYGVLGLDVGRFGRWSRLFWGLLILLPLALQTVQDLRSDGFSPAFYGQTFLYLLLIAAAYTLVYWFLGERLFARANPWVNTVILVVPAFLLAWWNPLFWPLTGLQLPSALGLAMGLYIGLSFILQWRLRYGGCEVVALPILLFKRRYTTYCIPLIVADAAEKRLVDRQGTQ